MKLLETEQEEVKTGLRGKGWNAPMALRVWRSNWQGWDWDHQSSLSKWWDLESPWKPLWVGLLGCFQEALTEAGRSTECGQHCSTGWGSRLNKKVKGAELSSCPSSLTAQCDLLPCLLHHDGAYPQTMRQTRPPSPFSCLDRTVRGVTDRRESTSYNLISVSSYKTWQARGEKPVP